MVDKISKIACAGRRGFSLIELMVVITIIALVAAVMVTVANHVQLNAKIDNTKMTITMLNSALEEYKAFKGIISGGEVFPIEVRTYAILEDQLNQYFNLPGQPPADLYEGDHNDMVWKDIPAEKQALLRIALSSIEFLYYSLDDIPSCRDILKRLPDSVVTNIDRDSVFIMGQEKTLKEVNDAWGRPIYYNYASGGYDNFPVLISAGEDGVFDTADDIVSSEF